MLVKGVIRSRDFSDNLLTVKFRNKAKVRRRVEVYSRVKKVTFYETNDDILTGGADHA